MLSEIRAFVSSNEHCFARTLKIGHVTGSAWVLNESKTHVLLTHHAQLGKWLQPGGHCDGDPDVAEVALREAQEESGLASVRLAGNAAIFDVDAHRIPARGDEPAHVHYDIRFLAIASMDEPLIVSEESHELAWVRLDDVASLNTDASVLRMVERTRGL